MQRRRTDILARLHVDQHQFRKDQLVYVDVLSTIEVVDCAEGTQMQLQKTQNPRIHVKKISKIFVTHLHVDHCMGIVPLLNNALPSNHAGDEHLRDEVRLQLYGPAGLRRFIRSNLNTCRMRLMGKYVVHELRHPDDGQMDSRQASDETHMNEGIGEDIWCDGDGLWKDFISQPDMRVHAGQIKHRIPCMGYVFDSPARKVVVLGDTSDPSSLKNLAMDASILVHEATNAWMPPDIDELRRSQARSFASSPSSSADDESNNSYSTDTTADLTVPTPPSDPPKLPPSNSPNGPNGGTPTVIQSTPASVRERAAQCGHSTPDMAGAFAASICARNLYMNHFSVKYPDAGTHREQVRRLSEMQRARRDLRERVISEIERQATEAWAPRRGKWAVAARDLMVVPVEDVE